MKIAIGSDHGGFRLKGRMITFLEKKGLKVKDFGTYTKVSCDYPCIAYRVAKSVSDRKYDRGILICKSGIGDSIVANKVKGVRAALVYNLKAARLSRRHNDANVLVLGAGFLSEGLAKRIASLWLNTSFEAGRHARRVRQISEIEKRVNKRKI